MYRTIKVTGIEYMILGPVENWGEGWYWLRPVWKAVDALSKRNYTKFRYWLRPELR